MYAADKKAGPVATPATVTTPAFNAIAGALSAIAPTADMVIVGAVKLITAVPLMVTMPPDTLMIMGEEIVIPSVADCVLAPVTECI